MPSIGLCTVCGMCNLYNIGSKDDIAVYLRNQRVEAQLAAAVEKSIVGPFGQGLFFRPTAGGLECLAGQWGLIRPGAQNRIELVEPKAVPGAKPRKAQPKSTNNARLESVHRLPTFSAAWKAGQRCLIPAAWYQEPNWETKKNIWWQLKRADGLPWMLAGLWSEWVDPETGELVPNFTMITRNCNEHPMLNRLHKPDPYLKSGQAEDKRAVVHVEPDLWNAWLKGDESQARDVLTRLPPQEFFDQTDAQLTDRALAELAGPSVLPEQPGLL